MSVDTMVEHNQLIPNAEGSNLSHEFTVKGKPVVLRAFRLTPSQRVIVEQGARLPCGNFVWGPLRVCCQVELHADLTQVILGVSGLYRVFVLDPDEDGIDDVVVVQYRTDVNETTTTCC